MMEREKDELGSGGSVEVLWSCDLITFLGFNPCSLGVFTLWTCGPVLLCSKSLCIIMLGIFCYIEQGTNAMYTFSTVENQPSHSCVGSLKSGYNIARDKEPVSSILSANLRGLESIH